MILAVTFTEAFIKMFSTVPDETLFFIVLCALGVACVLSPPTDTYIDKDDWFD
jgi:hypothetical protein